MNTSILKLKATVIRPKDDDELHDGTCPVRLVYATVLPRFAIFLPCASVRIEYDGKYKINKCKPQRLCFCGSFFCGPHADKNVCVGIIYWEI